MLNSLLTRMMQEYDVPAADLYFKNACGDFLHGEVERLAPTVFVSEMACLVMRHDLYLNRLPARRRLIYLIDEDLTAAENDPSRTFLDRQRMRLFESRASRRLGRYAGVAVANSPELVRQFNRTIETHLIRPYWSEDMPSLDHFHKMENGEIDIAFLGGLGQRTDLQFLFPVIGRILDQHPQARFHLIGQHKLPAALAGHPRISMLACDGWEKYRRIVAERRFHIVLHPMIDVSVKRLCRTGKIIEHAILGAAGVYSEGWNDARRVEDGRSGIKLPDLPEVWHSALNQLIANPEWARSLAHGGQVLARRLNDPRPQRNLWRKLLQLEPTGALI